MTCICQLLICGNGVCKVYYVQNINENEENALSYSRVLIKKGNIHGKSRLFRSGSSEAIFSEHDVFHKVQWLKDSSVSTWVIFLTSYLLKYITLSPDAMNKPNTVSFYIFPPCLFPGLGPRPCVWIPSLLVPIVTRLQYKNVYMREGTHNASYSSIIKFQNAIAK